MFPLLIFIVGLILCNLGVLLRNHLYGEPVKKAIPFIIIGNIILFGIYFYFQFFYN